MGDQTSDPYDISQDDEFIKEQKYSSQIRQSKRVQKKKGLQIEEIETKEDIVKNNEVTEVQQNEEPSTFPCPTCSRVFTSFDGRQRHMTKSCLKQVVQVAQATDGTCQCCGEELSTAHQVGKIECEDCKSKFKSKSGLKRHREFVHNEQMWYKCPECESQFDSSMSLAQHMYTHAGLKPWACDRCKVMFTRKYHLTRHITQTGCDGINRPALNCQVCGKLFNRKDNLREHLRAHAGVNKRRTAYSCIYCNETILGAHAYMQHKRAHTGNKPYACTFCDKSFATSGAQKKHIRIHTGEKPYACKECDSRFAAKEILNRHMKLHTGVRPYRCQFCSKGFIQASQLRAHLFYHTGESAFKCDECDMIFNRKNRLDLHNKYTHEGAEPLVCEDCKKTFLRKEDLNRHRLTHTGVKAHKCDKCDKSFTVKSSLKIHLLTHTKETPKACNYCNRAFIRQDCLLRHMRAKHRNKLEEILIEAERKKLQFQLLTMSATGKSSETSTMVKPSNTAETESTLSQSVSELLKLLVDEETLNSFGAPNASVDAILGMVIKRCGHNPIEDSELNPVDRLRENAKLLFTVVIDDVAVKTLLNNQSVDEVILHVLKLAKS